ncbi:hypothetical protein Vretifemale_5081 [Volvox reticuliferus]|uniref:Caffeoyl-CoA O-methyltransferase n=1 Tax=Volvox reticuliferus TaxID=1737510 RepID=A0A8J4FL58_9CHLO|nr:hypothetical protein Vretifemale_5081 [Volvox reticuliferus]
MLSVSGTLFGRRPPHPTETKRHPTDRRNLAGQRAPVSLQSTVPCHHRYHTRGPSAAPDVHGPSSLSGPGHPPGSLVPGETLNKIPLALGMTPRVYGYLLEHIREPQVLRQLREATAAISGAHMQVTPEQGALLGLLVEVIGARRVVEVGVFTGYSSCAMAMALPPDGQLVALDRDERPLELARRFWQLAGVADKVELRVGPALQSLEQLLERDGLGSYDMAFIDKRSYDQYYELSLKLVRPGGLIAIDNTLFYGRVAEPKASDKAAIALHQLNVKLLDDQRVSISMIPIGDGMTLCRRR